MEELFRFINVSCETSRFYLRNFSFMFGRGELIAISSDTTSAKDALVLLLTPVSYTHLTLPTKLEV